MSLVCLLAGTGALRADDGEFAVVVTGLAHFHGRSLALSALAAINNLAFATEGDRHVKLLPAAEARRQSRLTAP